MMFSQVPNDQIVQGFGLPAAIVIIGLVGALIFTVKLLLKSYDARDLLQEKRITDAKETRDSLVEPLKKNAQLSEQIYDIVLRNVKGN